MLSLFLTLSCSLCSLLLAVLSLLLTVLPLSPVRAVRVEGRRKDQSGGEREEGRQRESREVILALRGVSKG